MAGGGDPFREVRAGESLVVPAAAWNRLMAIAREANTPNINLKRANQNGPVEVVIKNESGVALSRFGVLAINGPLIDPASKPNGFLGRVAVSGVAVAAANLGALAVAIEPIGIGKIGRAVIRGVIPAQIKITSTLHRYARAISGSASLESASSGPVGIIWAEQTIGNSVHAIIDIDRGNAETLAVITGSTLISANKWKYDWAEVEIADGDFVQLAGGKSSTTYGFAYNLNEALNNSAGVQGNGVDIANLPVGFGIQPIGNGAVIRLDGPHIFTDLSTNWYFEAVNAVDGVCP